VKFARRHWRLPTTPKVLIVEDDPAIRGLLAAALRREPVHFDVAVDGLEALERVREHTYAVIVTDLMLPRLDGAAFVDAFIRLRPEARSVIFVMTAIDAAISSRVLGPSVHAVIRKPFDVARLIDMIRECALLRQAHEEVSTAALPERPPLSPGEAC
jgi:DNA-binding response OmpR family regulator